MALALIQTLTLFYHFQLLFWVFTLIQMNFQVLFIILTMVYQQTKFHCYQIDGVWINFKIFALGHMAYILSIMFHLILTVQVCCKPFSFLNQQLIFNFLFLTIIQDVFFLKVLRHFLFQYALFYVFLLNLFLITLFLFFLNPIFLKAIFLLKFFAKALLTYVLLIVLLLKVLSQILV